MKNKKGFNVSFHKKASYDFAKIHFCAKKHQNSNYEWVGEIEYQKNKDGSSFYGGRVNITGGRLFEVEMAYKILKDIEENVRRWSSEFEELLEYIKDNYHRCLYDPREQQITRVKDMRDKDIKRYMLQNSKGCVAAVLAKTEDEALETMIKKVKTGFKNDIYRKEIKIFLEEWLENPHVNLDSSTRNFEFESIEEIISPEGGAS